MEKGKKKCRRGKETLEKNRRSGNEKIQFVEAVRKYSESDVSM